MEIMRRGLPPYEVWTDSKEKPPFAPQRGYHGNDYLSAIKEVFEISDAGQSLGRKLPCIKDAKGDIVFNVENPSDLQLLKDMDVAQLINVIVINPD